MAYGYPTEDDDPSDEYDQIEAQRSIESQQGTSSAAAPSIRLPQGMVLDRPAGSEVTPEAYQPLERTSAGIQAKLPQGMVLDDKPTYQLPEGMVLDKPVAGADQAAPTEYQIPYSGALYPSIAQQRAKWVEEIESNPRLREYAAAAMSQEAGDDIAYLGAVEALFNRTQQRGSRISKELTNGFYGPVNRGEVDRIVRKGVQPWMYEKFDKAFAAVKNGSDLIEGRTDQGMINEIVGPKAKYGSEYFGYMGGDPTWSLQHQRNKGNPGAATRGPSISDKLIPLKGEEQGPDTSGILLPPGMVLDKPTEAQQTVQVPEGMVIDEKGHGQPATRQEQPTDLPPSELPPVEEKPPPKVSAAIALKFGLKKWIDQDTGMEVRRAELAGTPEESLPISSAIHKPKAGEPSLGINVPPTKAEAAMEEARGTSITSMPLEEDKATPTHSSPLRSGNVTPPWRAALPDQANRDIVVKLNEEGDYVPEWQRPLAKSPLRTGQNEWIDAANSFARGASSDGGMLSMFEGLYDIVGKTTKNIPGLKSISDNALKERGAVSAMRERVRKNLPVDKDFADSYGGQIASGLGQLTNLPIYVAAGAVGGPVGAGAAGVVMTVGQLWQEGKDDYKQTMERLGKPYNEAEADKAATQYVAGAAPLEMLADYTIIGKFLKGAVAKKLTIGQVLKEGTKTFTSEGSTEGLQQAWNNYVANTGTKYDPDRPYTQGVLDSFVVGGAVGGIAGTVGTIIEPRLPVGGVEIPKGEITLAKAPAGTLTGAAAQMGGGTAPFTPPYTPPAAGAAAPAGTTPATQAPSGAAQAPSAAPIAPTEQFIRSDTTEKSVAGANFLKAITKPNHSYRGMTEDEYNNTIAKGNGVKSSNAYSAPGEGTSFGEDAKTAESYINFGRDDPRKTGKKTYLVEVSNEGLEVNRQGYLYARKPVPQGQITRVWEMTGKGDSVIAREVSLTESPSNLAPITPTEEVKVTKSNTVRNSEGKKGEVVSEDKGKLEVQWEDDTKTTVEEGEVERRTKEETVRKNTVMMEPTAKGTKVHYYDDKGKKTTQFFKVEQDAQDRAKEIAKEKNLTGYSDTNDNFVRTAAVPETQAETTEAAPVTPAESQADVIAKKVVAKIGQFLGVKPDNKATNEKLSAKVLELNRLTDDEANNRLLNLDVGGRTVQQALTDRMAGLLPNGASVPIVMDNNGTGAAVQPDPHTGAIKLLIDPRAFGTELESMGPEERAAYFNKSIEEEEVHIADHISLWNDFQRLPPKEKARLQAESAKYGVDKVTGLPTHPAFNVYKDEVHSKIIKDLRDIRNGLSAGQKAQVDQILIDAINAYQVHPGVNASQIKAEGGYADPNTEGVYEWMLQNIRGEGHIAARQVDLMAEIVRMAVQSERTGKITEDTLAQVLHGIKKWVRDQLERIKRTWENVFGPNKSLAGERVLQVLKARVDAINAILDSAEVKRKLERNGVIQSFPDASPQLKAFWGETNVVPIDPNTGQQAVQYHYHHKDIEQFDYDNQLGYHVGTQKAAFDRCMDKTKGHLDEAIGAVTIAIHIRLERPVHLPDLGSWHPVTVASSLRDRGYITQDEITDIVQRDFELTNKNIKELLQKKGYDGVAYVNSGEGRRQLTMAEADARLKESSIKRNTGAPYPPVTIHDPLFNQVIGSGNTEGEARAKALMNLTRQKHPIDYSFILFEGNQLKSAKANNGSYSLGDRNIMRAKGLLEKTLESRIVEMHNRTGGSSINAALGDVSEMDVYAVEAYPDLTMPVPGRKITEQDIFNLQNKIREHGIDLNVPYLTIGTWVNEETGDSELGVSALVPDMRAALEMAEKYNQIAIWYHGGIGSLIFTQGAMSGANLPSLGERTGFIAKKSIMPVTFKPRISDPYSYNITNLPPGKVEGVPIISDKAITESAKKGQDWKDWYTTWDQYMRRLTAKHPEYHALSAWFFAATSPQSLVGANVASIIRAFRNFVETGDPGITFGAMESHQFNLRRVVGKFPTGAMHEPTAVGGGFIGGGTGLSGGKVTEFAPALLGDRYAVAVDMHVASILFGTKSPTEWQRFAGQMAIMRISNRMGWSPAEVQAAIFADHIMQTGEKGVLGRAEKYMEQYETEFLNLIEQDQAGGAKGAGIGRSILERASTRVGPERFLRDASGNIAAIQRERIIAINPAIASRISLTGPKGPIKGSIKAKGLSRYHVPGHMDIEDVDMNGRYWVDPDGEIYDVDATKAIGHRGFAADYLGASLGTSASKGWVRVVTEPDDMGGVGGTVHWEGDQANAKQQRTFKDIGAILGYDVKRDRGGTIAYDRMGEGAMAPKKPIGAKGLGRGTNGQPTTAENARIPSAFLNLPRMWNGVKQVFWNSPGCQALGDAVHQHTDLLKKYMAEFSSPFLKWVGEASGHARKMAINEYQEWQQKKVAGQPLPALSPEAKKLKAVYDGVIAKINAKNQYLNLKVKHPDTGNYVKIPNIEHPSKIKGDVMQTMRDAQWNHSTWRELRDALIAENILPSTATDEQVQNHFDKVLRNHSTNSAFGRFFFFPKSMPSTAFDYSYEAMHEFLGAWTQKVALVEAFGTNPKNDIFDIAANKARDLNTQNYIRAVKRLAYGETINDFWGRMATSAGQLAMMWHLINFAYATKNLVSGMAFNAQSLGIINFTKAFFQVNPFRAINDGVERGIIVRDMMNIMADADRIEAQTTSIMGVKFKKFGAAAQEATSAGLNWTGAKLGENWVRGVAMRGSESMLRHAMKEYKKNPRSGKSLRYAAYLQRLGFRGGRHEALLQEGGKGELTDEYLRAAVNEIQGGYTYADVPVYMETPAGKALFKYRKWGAEQAKHFEREVVMPMLRMVPGVKKETVQIEDANGNLQDMQVPPGVLAFMPAARYLVMIAAAGAGEEWLLEKMFGMHPKTARLAEAMAQFKQSNWEGTKALLNKVWNWHLLAGSMGGIGGYIQEGLAFTGLQDAKPGESAAESIPALDPFLKIADQVKIFMEQGTYTTHNIMPALMSISGVRVGVQAAAQITDVIGMQTRFSETIANRQDLATAKGLQRRYADDVGYKLKKPSGERPEKTEKSVWRDPLDEALMIGDIDTAKQILRDVKKGMRGDQWEAEVKSLKSHIRSKQPIQATGGSEASRHDFMQWMKENASPYEQELVKRLDKTYRHTAERLPLGLEFKPPSLEDILKHRQSMKLRQLPTEYQPSE